MGAELPTMGAHDALLADAVSALQSFVGIASDALVNCGHQA